MVVRVRFPLLVLFQIDKLELYTTKVVKNCVEIYATTNEDNLIAKRVHNVNIKDSVEITRIADE